MTCTSCHAKFFQQGKRPDSSKSIQFFLMTVVASLGIACSFSGICDGPNKASLNQPLNKVKFLCERPNVVGKTTLA